MWLILGRNDDLITRPALGGRVAHDEGALGMDFLVGDIVHLQVYYYFLQLYCLFQLCELCISDLIGRIHFLINFTFLIIL